MTEAPKPPEGENIFESAFPSPLISRSGSATRLSQTWSLSQPSQFSYVACRGFVKYTRSKIKYRPPKQRMKDWNEIYYSKGKSELKVQAARWVCFLKHHKKLFYWLHFTIIFFNLNWEWSVTVSELDLYCMLFRHVYCVKLLFRKLQSITCSTDWELSYFLVMSYTKTCFARF